MSDISRPLYDRPFPRGPLIGAGALVTVALLSAVAGRLAGSSIAPPPDASVLASRELRFEDRPDGGVSVLDARDDSLVDVAAPGTNGFLRATLRGLARERRLNGVGAGAAGAPFRVTAWSDERVTLDDLATGRHVELEAFGGTNEAVFARLLLLPGAAP